jgi:hypothetical protein
MLTLNRRKARYGVSYLRSVCAQAGVGLTETAPDEDVYAIDCDLKYGPLTLPVQVKCTAQHILPAEKDPWVDVDPTWATKWEESVLPVHLVLVIVEADPEVWLGHHDNGTWHPAAAYWVHVTGAEKGRLKFPLEQRLDAAAVTAWYTNAMAGFGGAA